jgi:probable F420-dependent oxidoreductase
MKFMYVFPEATGPDASFNGSGSVADLARAAEAAGFEGFAFTEHPAPSAKWLATGGHQAIDPFAGLAHVAAVTSKLRLLTYLAVVPYRNPLLMAKSAATVDFLSEGRMILGLGTGYLKSEFFALGVDFDERNAAMDEALDVLPLHWSGQPFSFTGSHFEARDVQALPAPVQQPIPIWIGGNARVTMQRVASKANGWMPLLSSPMVTNTSRTAYVDRANLGDKVAELNVMAGPRATGLDVASSISIDESRTVAQQAGELRDQISQLAAAGSTWIMVPPATSTPTVALEFISSFMDLAHNVAQG